MKNLDKKFNKLVKYFEGAEKDLQFEYDWNGGDGSFSRSNLDIIYNSPLDAETFIDFDLNASKIIEVDEGDSTVSRSFRTLQGIIEVNINLVMYQGESICLTIAQQYALELIIQEQISID